MQKYTFGELLKGFRDREGLSQQELANALGVHRNTISAWERSEYLPDNREIILKLARELNLHPVETDQLLYAADRPLEYQSPEAVLSLLHSTNNPSLLTTVEPRHAEDENLELIGNFIASAPTPVESKERGELEILLGRVKQFWVEGVLEKSVHAEALIALGKEAQPDQVDHPWSRVLELPNQTLQILPPDKKIVDIFFEMQSSLLILGEPGSGKTITLLELARDLIRQVEITEDFAQPIPVVFNLSSWTDKRQRLIDWLVDELTAKYQIPRRIGRPWLESHRILPLLDGLDEVKGENRANCIQAINSFGEDFGLAGLVICSRLKEYVDLPVRLKLNGAIRIQPLTPEQINDYLVRLGSKLVSLHLVLHRDHSFLELAQSPLMLSIMTLVYQDGSFSTNTALETTEARQKHLFDAYIEQMFRRKGKFEKPYTDQQTIGWLAWLANNMVRHNQTTFLIEQLQPSWLSTSIWLWSYILTSRLIGTVIIGLLIGINVGIEGDFSLQFSQRLEFGLITGITSGIIIGLLDGFRFRRSSEVYSTKKTSSQLMAFFFTVGSIGALMGVVAGVVTNWFIRTLGVLSFGVIIGMLFGLKGSYQTQTNDIQPVEGLSWSWKNALRRGNYGLIIGLLFGLIGGILTGLTGWLKHLFLGATLVKNSFQLILNLLNRLTGEPIIGLNFVLSNALIYGSIGVLVGATFGGLSNRILGTKTHPNQGILLSVRNAIFTGLIFPLIFFIAGELSFWLLFMLTSEPIEISHYDILRVAVRFGLPAALWYGGLDIIKHFTLRFFLSFNGYIPWNYARFLDYAAERIFLRKVGGGYIFIHRLLLEHFATLNQ